MAGKPETQIRPISNIVIVVAMEMEALPIVNRFRLTRQPHSSFPERVPWVRYGGTYKDLSINLIWPGKDPASGADSIGTIPSALVTYAAIQALQPDLIINAGTTGGFKVGTAFSPSNNRLRFARVLNSQMPKELVLGIFLLYQVVLFMTEEYLYLVLICMELVYVKPLIHQTL
ncbi:hypothetical protein PHAVU_009G000700 [Phaseolus vulgaris]